MAFQDNLISFESVEGELKQFAESIGGEYSFSPGLSHREIQYSKSEVSKWLDKTVINPLIGLFGQSEEQLKKDLDERYKNAYVDCRYRNWAIRFHVRNVGFGFSTPGKLGLRVTCPIGAGDFRFSLYRKVADASPSEIAVAKEPKAMPGYLKPLIPQGILADLETDQGTFGVQFHRPDIDAIYVVRSNNHSLADRLLGDPRILAFLGRLQYVNFLKIGYLDGKMGTTDRLFELDGSIALSMDDLNISFKFAQTALDILEGDF
jgi:hypothetical protein